MGVLVFYVLLGSLVCLDFHCKSTMANLDFRR